MMLNAIRFTILTKEMFLGTLLILHIVSYFRPFGLCSEVLTTNCIQKYFMPLVEMVPKFLDDLTDEELKKESKIEGKNDALSGVIKALKCLASRLQGQEETVKNLEIFRLKMILRFFYINKSYTTAFSLMVFY